jgi:peptide/nickel transport system ATP-binding protein
MVKTPSLATDQATLLQVQDLSVEFRTRSGCVRALEEVTLGVRPGEMVGIVGESGSGKSVTAFTIMGVLDPAARITSGQIRFGTHQLLQTPERTLRQLRGKEMSMIFQNPRLALNPIRTVGHQIEDVLRCHASVPASQLQETALAALASVRIPDPARRYHAYPYQLSGGMCQRIMIALALACRPRLLIADEPTTGLDVTTQAAIMDLIQDLAASQQMATLLITHDLALASEYCQRIVVMHAGHVVETASTPLLFRAPRHPYTARLIAATPEPHKPFHSLQPIPGNLPDLRQPLAPCRFSRRCDRHTPECDQHPLFRQTLADDHEVACWHPLT